MSCITAHDVLDDMVNDLLISTWWFRLSSSSVRCLSSADVKSQRAKMSAWASLAPASHHFPCSPSYSLFLPTWGRSLKWSQNSRTWPKGRKCWIVESIFSSSSMKCSISEISTIHKIQDFVHLGLPSGSAVRPGLGGREQRSTEQTGWCHSVELPNKRAETIWGGRDWPVSCILKGICRKKKNKQSNTQTT